MKKLIILLFLSITFVQRNALANEACSRIAIINQQEFLVDPNLNRKGEGLRFYLARDENSKTIDNNNEKYLIEAVHEYNKRREPKIYFKSKDGEVTEPKMYLEKTWSF